MNIPYWSINNNHIVNINEAMKITYPSGAVWSRKAITELFRQLSWLDVKKVNQIIDRNDDIQKAWNPTELAKAISKQLPNDIVLLPIYNKYWWNVTSTIEAYIDIYIHTWKMPRTLGNVEIEIKHCLCWKPWLTQKEIKKWIIYSHEQAITQCSEKINNLWIKTVNVSWTEVMIDKAKTNDDVLLIIDEDTATKNWLEIYDNKFWPEDNRTSFVVLTSNKEVELPKINGNDDINVWLLEVDNKEWGLLMSLLPLILLEKEIDLKAITSSIKKENPMIWIVAKNKRFEQAKWTYEHIINKNPDSLKILMLKLHKILKKNYNIQINHNKWNSYTISSNNCPWALVKMLILLEYNWINLNSIDSKIRWNKVEIDIETLWNIEWIKESNMPEWIKKHLENLIDNNLDRIHEIITV